MNGTAVAVRERPSGGALAIWDNEQLEIIKNIICPGASDVELALFANHCQRTGLDPLTRQTYGIMRAQNVKQPDGQWKTIEKLSIQNSIDGLRLIAERTEHYGGQLGPQWCGKDGVWRDVWLEDEYPAAARVGVIRKDWKDALWAVATWKSYVQTYRKNNQDVVGNMWQRMPDVMLAKVAESLALRRAFPQELSGVYGEEEMAQADRGKTESAIEDLPQFQQALRVESVQSAPGKDEPIGETLPKGVPTSNAKTTAPSSGAGAPAGTHAADAETRARFETNWTKGVARAVACGVAPDEKPRPDATKGALNIAQRELMEAIKARETLNAVLTERVGQVRATGATIKDIEPAKLTDAEVHKGIADLDAMLAPDDSEDETF